MPVKQQPPQCATCPLGQYFRARPITRDEPGEPAGWECRAQDDKFIPSWDAPSECPYFDGYNAAPPHPLDVALRKRDEQAAALWLVENVPSHVLGEALADAPESPLNRAARIHRAEACSEHTYRSGALENG